MIDMNGKCFGGKLALSFIGIILVMSLMPQAKAQLPSALQRIEFGTLDVATYDNVWDSCISPDYSVYLVGVSGDDDYDGHIVLSKWSSEAEPQWSSRWSERIPMKTAVSIALSETAIYTAYEFRGVTLLKWGTDGTLIWNVTTAIKPGGLMGRKALVASGQNSISLVVGNHTHTSFLAFSSEGEMVGECLIDIPYPHSLEVQRNRYFARTDSSIYCFSSLGEMLWNYTFPITRPQYGSDMVLVENDSLYSLTGDDHQYADEKSQIIVSRIDTVNGDALWNTSISSTNGLFPRALAVSDTKSIFVLVTEEISYNMPPGSDMDTRIYKFNTQGKADWNKTMTIGSGASSVWTSDGFPSMDTLYSSSLLLASSVDASARNATNIHDYGLAIYDVSDTQEKVTFFETWTGVLLAALAVSMGIAFIHRTKKE